MFLTGNAVTNIQPNLDMSEIRMLSMEWAQKMAQKIREISTPTVFKKTQIEFMGQTELMARIAPKMVAYFGRDGADFDIKERAAALGGVLDCFNQDDLGVFEYSLIESIATPELKKSFEYIQENWPNQNIGSQDWDRAFELTRLSFWYRWRDLDFLNVSEFKLPGSFFPELSKKSEINEKNKEIFETFFTMMRGFKIQEEFFMNQVDYLFQRAQLVQDLMINAEQELTQNPVRVLDGLLDGKWREKENGSAGLLAQKLKRP